jgi:hypothetical protein
MPPPFQPLPPPCAKCGITTVIDPAVEECQRVFVIRCPACRHVGTYSLDYSLRMMRTPHVIIDAALKCTSALSFKAKAGALAGQFVKGGSSRLIQARDREGWGGAETIMRACDLGRWSR